MGRTAQGTDRSIRQWLASQVVREGDVVTLSIEQLGDSNPRALGTWDWNELSNEIKIEATENGELPSAMTWEQLVSDVCQRETDERGVNCRFVLTLQRRMNDGTMRDRGSFTIRRSPSQSSAVTEYGAANQPNKLDGSFEAYTEQLQKQNDNLHRLLLAQSTSVWKPMMDMMNALTESLRAAERDRSEAMQLAATLVKSSAEADARRIVAEVERDLEKPDESVLFGLSDEKLDRMEERLMRLWTYATEYKEHVEKQRAAQSAATKRNGKSKAVQTRPSDD